MKAYMKGVFVLKNQKGVSAVIVAILLAMLFCFAALAIDVGYMYVTRNELQNIADAAALAGARELGIIYLAMDYSDQANYDVDADGGRPSINSAAIDVAGKNKAANLNIVINSEDIFIGQWDGTNLTVTPTTPDAVRVIARRDDSANGPVTAFFAAIFNIFGGDHDTFSVSAVATAALTGPSIVDEGEMKLPIGLSENQFPNNCTDEIQFSPTTDSCAGWHNFLDPINASKLSDKLLGFIQADVQPDGSTGAEWLETHFEMNQPPDEAVTPETTTEDSYEFQGGTISSLFLGGKLLWDTPPTPTMPDEPIGIDGDPKHPAPFPALFDYFRFRDGDDDNSVWTATSPVYKDSDECINPNTDIELVGFATVKVIMPNPPPDSTVTVQVECNLTLIEGRGGGGVYGNIKGSIPNLVE
jgi:Flp pilus assembly protein TadG